MWAGLGFDCNGVPGIGTEESQAFISYKRLKELAAAQSLLTRIADALTSNVGVTARSRRGHHFPIS